MKTALVIGTLAALVFLVPEAAFAQGGLDSGDTAWMLIASALVLFMTIPGLSLFYAGLVRSKNVLSVNLCKQSSVVQSTILNIMLE